MKVALPALLGGSSTAAVIMLPLLLAFYPAQISTSATSASYTADSFGYEIQELAPFPVSNLLYNNNSSSDIPANRTMALSANSSTSVYETETFIAPPTVKTFVIYMANEFHENWPEDSHKHITNKNAYTIPTNLTISNGTSIAFHMADAPWDTPHDYIVRVIDTHTNETALQTPLLNLTEVYLILEMQSCQLENIEWKHIYMERTR
jgi:hypothetical protein